MVDLHLGDNKVELKKIGDNTVDLVVTSPPYDNLRTYDGTLNWGWSDFKRLAEELWRVVKPGGVIVWVVGDATIDGSETGTSFRQALYFKELGFNLHDTMLYVKENWIPLTHNRYEQQFEYMFVFSKGKPNTFNPIKIPCKFGGKIEKYRKAKVDEKQAIRVRDGEEWRVTNDEKIHTNLWVYSCGQSRTGHPAAFPDELARDMIISWSNEGDVVLDPFMGSGTTGKMATLLGRSFIGIEIVPKYFELSKSVIGNTNVLW